MDCGQPPPRGGRGLLAMRRHAASNSPFDISLKHAPNPCFCRAAREQDSEADATDAEGPRRSRPILEYLAGLQERTCYFPLS
jgi:hypothetical protein